MDDGIPVFNLICGKASARFGDEAVFEKGVLEFEAGKSGYAPDVPKWFTGKYQGNIERFFSITSKDQMEVVNVYEFGDGVGVILASGS